MACTVDQRERAQVATVQGMVCARVGSWRTPVRAFVSVRFKRGVRRTESSSRPAVSIVFERVVYTSRGVLDMDVVGVLIACVRIVCEGVASCVRARAPI